MISPSFRFWGFAVFDAAINNAGSQEQGKDVVKRRMCETERKLENSVFATHASIKSMYSVGGEVWTEGMDGHACGAELCEDGSLCG